MDIFTLLVGVLTLYLLVRMLQLTATPEQPKLFYRSPTSSFVLNLLELCPILTSVFKPTIFWGKSGHFQTCIHAKMGRTKPKKSMSTRFHVKMPDGATMSYDVFNPQGEGNKAKFTLAICPGIANTSECIYISCFATYAQSHGYRVAVLNHLGSLKSEQLTSPRIFTYGGTDEYRCMIEKLLQDFPTTKILAVGFSMGGNIVTKFLGENRDNQTKVLCGASICQGYEVNRAKDHFLEWSDLRRLYTYGMTLKQRRLLARHRDKLFTDAVKQSIQQIDENKVFRATSLTDIDENYSCYNAGFSNVKDYYDWVSSAYCMQNISIPMLYMNAEDDPLVPPPLFVFPRDTAEKKDNSIFVTTRHGGHLGFFEGGHFVPNEITWMDRFVIEYADAIVHLYLQNQLPLAENLPLTTPTNSPTEEPANEDICDIGESADSLVAPHDGEVVGDSTGIDTVVCLHGNDVITSHRNPGTKDKASTGKDDKKEGSLKRGSILQQATSYVQ